DLLSTPPDLSSFKFVEASMTFEVYIDDKNVQFKNVKDDVNTYLRDSLKCSGLFLGHGRLQRCGE
ncbi:hypothetical protein, partial [Klebsiella variicola]|uniref:hypothetical protein n=1 Tax=Klebsiella variicola TaxID=244366 RepID=UPI002730C92D